MMSSRFSQWEDLRQISVGVWSLKILFPNNLRTGINEERQVGRQRDREDQMERLTEGEKIYNITFCFCSDTVLFEYYNAYFNDK